MAEFNPNDGVIYLTIGTKHLVHIVVSLYSLRQRYDGPVAILSGDNYFDDYVASESRLGPLEVIPFEYQKTNAYHAKTSMHELSPFDRTVFLDADTLVVGDFSDMLPDTVEEVKWTQFADWTTHHPGGRRGKLPRIAGRINDNAWPELLPKQAAYQTEHPYPAINTGVLGFSKGSRRVMKKWHQVTSDQFRLSREREDVSAFISDEVAAQLLAFEYPHRIMDCRFNCSPVYNWPRAKDVRIWHGHGAKFFKMRNPDDPTARMNGARRQNEIWLPYFFECLRDDIAGISKWHETPRWGKKRPSLHVHDLNAKYEYWLEHGEIPLEIVS